MTPGSFLRSVVGATLLWGSAAAGGYAVAWTIRSHSAGHHLLRNAGAELAASSGFDPSRSCTASVPSNGQLAGLLEVPALGLKAPVEEGESDATLSAAVGHDPASVWPGTSGTSVLAAHDVSYFAKIDSLFPGALVQYVSACRVVTFKVTGHHVVAAGSPVGNATTPELVLDTCWPTDALWWTPDRLLVTAVEISSVPRLTHLAAPASVASQPLAVPAPLPLVSEGLTLDTNPTLLGQLSVGGGAGAGFAESPEPLAVEEAALTAYYGGLHSLSQGRTDWWSAIAPGVAYPAQWSGTSITEYLTRLSVQVLADGLRPTGAVLSANVDLRQPSGAVVPMHLSVTCVVHGDTLTLAGWQVQP